jgi:AcrR family transcriptional regulator
MVKSKHDSRLDDTSRLVKNKKMSRGQKAKQTSKNPAQHRGNRHGRSEAAREAVLQAADDLLVESGFAGVTIEGIAARAGVGKQTIYRWWSSKTDILMDAFLEDAAEQLIPPDLGDLGADLRSHLRNCAEFLSKSDSGAVFRALVGEAQHDKQIAKRVRSQYLDEQRTRDYVPFERAKERGELAPNTDLGTAIDQLIAPIHYRVLVTGEPVTAEYTDLLVQRLLKQLKSK